MNFEVFTALPEDLLYRCQKAESLARVRPGDAAIAARSALEKLFTRLISSMPRPADWGTRPPDLSAMIQYACTQLKNQGEHIGKTATEIVSIADDILSTAHTIRISGNKAVHPKEAIAVDRATQKNISNAILLVKKLYSICQVLYSVDRPFNPDDIPFQDYSIVRKVDKYPGEIVCDDFNYFVVFGDEDDGDRYYYLQTLSLLTEQAMKDRHSEISMLLNKKPPRFSYLLRPVQVHKTLKGSDRKFFIYPVEENTFLLSEYQTGMTLPQALGVGLDLISSLQEMKDRFHAHHRNICPGCVLLTPSGDRFDAYLIGMQTCKLPDSKRTIVLFLPELWVHNPFIPYFFVADGFTAWEKLDVWCVLRLILYCLAPSQKFNTLDDLFRVPCQLPDPLFQLFTCLFEEDMEFPNVPNLDQLKEALTNALNEPQQ